MNLNKTVVVGKSVCPVLILLSILLLTGCVSSSKYKDLETQYSTLEQEKSTLEEEKRELGAQFRKLERENSKANSENINLKTELGEIKDKYNESIKEKTQQKQGMQEMIVELESKLSTTEAQVTMIQDTLRVELIDKLFFKSGSADISKKGRDLLKQLAPILKGAQDKEIRVVGHADELPPGPKIAGKYPSNWELSVARATAVINVMQWGYGIDPRRLVAQGVGHYRNEEIAPGAKDNKMKRVVEIYLGQPGK